MKRLIFAVAMLGGCTEIRRPLYIASNVPAAVYVDGHIRGATPVTLDLADGEKIVLKANGYLPVSLNVETTERKSRVASTVSSDKPKAEFLLANGGFGTEGFHAGYGAFTSTSYPVYLATDLPSEATRVLMPYRIEEYAPQQVFATLQKRVLSPKEEQAAKIRRFILHAFNPKSVEFTAALAEMTQLSAGDLTALFVAYPTPDSAAVAVIRQWEKAQE